MLLYIDVRTLKKNKDKVGNRNDGIPQFASDGYIRDMADYEQLLTKLFLMKSN